MTELSTTQQNKFDTVGIETVTVGVAGYYDITADGAQGGSSTQGGAGGDGAMASGEIYLRAGAKLEIVVGGEGTSSSFGGGGGGGSFVIETYDGSSATDVNEVIGGGGGGSGGGGTGAGGGGRIAGGGQTKGTGGSGGGSGGGGGGSNGAAGDGSTLFDNGGGGGGFTGGKGGDPNSTQNGSVSGTSFDGGGAGGAGGGAGGFGGGGGGGGAAGGGGGGFGGGGGGGFVNTHGGGGGGGGGGGSLVNTSNSLDVTKTGATNTGNGHVTITAVEATFYATGEVQTFTAQASGYYDITADGAQGGGGYRGAGGLGALASGDVYLQAGTTLEIIVGSRGITALGGGGGGGGTFVIETGTAAGPLATPIYEVIGGGGGGGGLLGGGGAGLGRPTGGHGGAGGSSGGGGGTGGVGGHGGMGGSGSDGGGGGGGFTGGAGSDTGGGGGGTVLGSSFSGGQPSGNAGVDGTGGFGGGGGGSTDGGGGGGGWGGGGGSGFSGAGGGGSYVNADAGADPTKNATTQTGGATQGAGGFVSIAYPTTVCFCHDTLIATPAGEVKVQNLAVGDWVLTHTGEARPIAWIGSRHLDLTRHPTPDRVRPILIRAGAFADAVPHRDLFLSPDHAVLRDGLLIPAQLLVNGASIQRDTLCRAVTYYHVELDAHDILLAENLPAESYLDTGNRCWFDNAGVPLLLHPDLSNDQARRETESCLPFADDPGLVEPVWRALAMRAVQLGWQRPPEPETTDDPALCLIVEGRPVAPLTVADGRYVFVLPRAGMAARLVSRSALPSETQPWLSDDRRLGVLLRGLTFRGGASVLRIPLDHPALDEGWWQPEWHSATGLRRWTNGDALLPMPDAHLMGPGPCLLEVEMAAGLIYPLCAADGAEVEGVVHRFRRAAV